MTLTTHALPLLSEIRHVALDMDGTIYKGAALFPETVPFLEQLRQLDIGYTFLTNNPSKSRRDYLRHLARMGVPGTEENLDTTVQATLRHLRCHLPLARNLFFLGTPSMIGEFEEAGYVSIDEHSAVEPDAVIVAFDPAVTGVRLCKTAWWIAQGKPYIATNPDRVCPTDQPTILLDCGSICAAFKEATGRAPDAVLGKPDPSMLAGILEKHRLKPFQLAMVGDRLYTDVAMARRAGSVGVLVLTGEASAEDAAHAAEPPDLVIPNIGHLGPLLAEARNHSLRASVL